MKESVFQRMCTSVSVCIFSAAVSGLTAAEFIWAGGENGRWNDPLSYEGGTVGGAVPGASDEVWIPENTTVNVDVTDAESFAVFANMHCIHPTNDSSVLVLDVPPNVTSVVNSAITFMGWAKGNVGYLVKKGAGGLELTSHTRYNNNGNTNYRDNYVNYIVEAGTLILPRDTVTAHNGYYGAMSVSNGATVVLERAAHSKSITVNTYMYSLDGEGTIVNEYTGSGSHTLRVIGKEKGAFSGILTDRVRWFGSGISTLAGTGSTMANPFQHYGNGEGTFYDGVEGLNSGKGIIGIMKFGKTGEPSSIGSSEDITSRDYGAVFRYLGTGETTDKTLTVWDTERAPVVIDGGAHGGLDWAGEWTQNTSKSNGKRVNHRLVLTGSNTVPCVFSGKLNSATFADSGTVQTKYDFHIAKYGSGTWRFADGADNETDRTFAGGIAVHEGVLQFESLSEKGTVCSLGTATNLHAEVTGPETLPQVDYAYLLGGGEGVSTAVLEYVGTNVRPVSSASACERHIALNGRGTVRANGRWMGMSGVSAVAAGNHTLVLDGTGTAHNVMSDITDGAGEVSVEKRGSGTWAIGRDLSFSGSLDVKEGTLLVRPADRYSWFRWTIQENQSTATNGNETIVGVQELGFFDDDGARQNLGLAMNPDVHSIACGEVALDTCYGYKMTAADTGVLRELFNLFDDKNTDPGWMISLSSSPGNTSGGYRPRMGLKDSWLPVVVRLPKGANEIASWDWVVSFRADRGTVGRNPGRYVLEGSVDGLNWDMLSVHHEEEVPAFVAGTYYWRFAADAKHDENSTTGPGNVHEGGEPISGRPGQTYSTLGNVRSVSVAAGASLVADGDPVNLPSGVVLSVSAGGNGRLDGFAFPESGTVDVVGWNGESGFSGFDLSGATGVGNISGWSVTVDGAATSRLKVKASAEGFSLVKRGMAIVIR